MEENIINEDIIFSEESLDEALNRESSISDLPDDVMQEKLDPMLEERENLKVGLTPEDIKSLYQYISGEGEKVRQDRWSGRGLLLQVYRWWRNETGCIGQNNIKFDM